MLKFGFSRFKNERPKGFAIFEAMAILCYTAKLFLSLFLFGWKTLDISLPIKTVLVFLAYFLQI